MDPKTLRRTFRQQRRALSPQQQQLASHRLFQNLRNHPLFCRAQSVALYLANDGEINPQPLIELLWKENKKVYLPVLHPILENQLWFYEYDRQTPMRHNAFRILEPDLHCRHRRPTWSINLVLFPLVAFDEHGGRMGMGGGFYDRTFAFTRRRHVLRPRLVGLAHDFQKVKQLNRQPWDVPLDAVATDHQVYCFS